MRSSATIDQQRLSQPRGRRQWLGQLMSPLAWTIYGLWLLFMIAMPHIMRLGNDSTLTWSLSASVVIQAVLVLAVLWPNWARPQPCARS